MTDPLVSSVWLADRLGDPDLVILDGTYHLPTVDRDADAEFAERHIPGAQRFDIDAVCDPDSDLPHMIPSAEAFQAAAAGLGISAGTMVVVYDVYGLQSAARTWWMFRLFGHDRVAVLDGGLKKWLQEARPVETGAAAARPRGQFSADFQAALVADRQMVLNATGDDSVQIVDARAAGRFTGVDPEPRQGMRSGHIPGSRSLPFTELLDSGTREVLDATSLEGRFETAGIDPGRPLIASCGSGVTACVIALAAHRLGHPNVSVYDGSWSEWGGRADTPIETGPA